MWHFINHLQNVLFRQFEMGSLLRLLVLVLNFESRLIEYLTKTVLHGVFLSKLDVFSSKSWCKYEAWAQFDHNLPSNWSKKHQNWTKNEVQRFWHKLGFQQLGMKIWTKGPTLSRTGKWARDVFLIIFTHFTGELERLTTFT